MSRTEITSIVSQLQEWEQIMDEAKEMVESLKDTIKAEMNARGVEEMEAGQVIVRWTSVTTNRIDTGLLRKTLPDVAAQFTRASISRRFSIT